MPIVATVPPQHMYGFESSVLIALHGGAAFDAGRPFYPADVVATLAATPAPRALVTTPFHLKALLESGVAMPRVELVVCATAPLAPQLAARSEAAFAAPLIEITAAPKRPVAPGNTAGAEWRTFDGWFSAATTRARGERGHVPEPTPSPRLEVSLPTASAARPLDDWSTSPAAQLAGHSTSSQAIEGVIDGAFWAPPETADAPHARCRLRRRPGSARADPRRPANPVDAASCRAGSLRSRPASRGDRQAHGRALAEIASAQAPASGRR